MHGRLSEVVVCFTMGPVHTDTPAYLVCVLWPVVSAWPLGHDVNSLLVLIAQARVERATIVTHDWHFGLYDVPTIWI